MATDNLQHKTFYGIIWGFMEKFSMQLVTFCVGIILARLLSPSDYGLIAMAAVFVAISQIVVDSGFSSALIRKADRTDLDYSTVFDINVGLSVVMGGLLCISSHWIAAFYNEPQLVGIISLNGLYVFLGSFISVQRTKLIADLQFKTRSKINIINSLIGGAIAIAMAFAGFGVWALVYPNIITVFTGAVLYWYYQRWFPGVRFSKSSAKEMFSFGSKLLMSTILNTIYTNVYPMVIGKKFSASFLGFYTKGASFASLPSTTIASVVGEVAYPVLSSIQDDDERLRNVYRQILRLSAYIVFPIMLGIAALAHPLIIILITDRWEASVIYLQILCLAFMWYPIHGLNLNLLQVKGRSDLFLKLEIIKKFMGVIVLLITLPMGLLWMCVGLVVSSLLSLAINTYHTGKLIKVGLYVQMIDLLPSIGFSFSMGGLIFFLLSYISSPGIQLAAGTVFGVIYYYTTSLLFQSKDFADLRKILKTNMTKFSR